MNKNPFMEKSIYGILLIYFSVNEEANQAPLYLIKGANLLTHRFAFLKKIADV